MEKIRIGILGSGNWANVHARTVAQIDNAELVAVAGGRRAPRFAKTYSIRYEKKPEDLLRATDVDAVIIASPHSFHEEQAIRAARNGKHILVEKPMATSVEGCARMIEAANKSGVKLMVGHSRRYFPVDRHAKTVIDQDQIGKILMVRVFMEVGAPDLTQTPKDSWFFDPKLSMGLFIGFGIHLVDRLIWWVDSPIKEVFAKFGNYWIEEPVENGGIVFVTFANGAYATLCTLYSAPPGVSGSRILEGGGDTAQIVGEKGLLNVKSYDRVMVKRGRDWELVFKPEPGEVEKDVFKNEDQDFVNAIVENIEPPITGEDGRRAVQLCMSAYQSWKEDRLVKLL